MKTCPQCDTGYPDSHTVCPIHGHLLNEIRELRPGMVIHKTYRIVRKLGQGGMGAVYLAQHILMDEPRALKFLSPELSRDQAFTARFLREVRTLRQIRNRNVVDCGDLEAAEDDSLFFSMEFVDGPDLRQLMNNTTGPLGDKLALSIARQIAEGLGAAHTKGMVHRDIKPENILMARDGDAWLPKIADFGIVATKESSTAYTRTGGTLLTMAYAAPEQWRGTPAAELDGRTDLYALGGLLYEMLTGQTPFHAENYEGWARQHQTTPPQPPSTLRPDLANWQGLDALTLRLLAKDRNDRPKDVAELLNLIDAVRYLPPEVRQATVLEVRQNTVPEVRKETVWEDAETSDQEADKKFQLFRTIEPRGHVPRWLWIASVAVFLVAGFVLWRILGPQQAVPTTLPAPQPSFTAQQHQETPQPSTTIQQHQENPQPFTPAPAALMPAHGGGMNPAAQPGTIPNPTPNATTLLVTCDLACNWKLDGTAKGRIEAGSGVKENVEFGQHLVTAATMDGLDKAENNISIKTAGQTIVHIVLQPVHDLRLKMAEAQDEQDELAGLVWTDHATGLMWAKKDNGSDVNWQQATDYCRNLQLAGHSDWRLQPAFD
jgi:serine/threonine protein kinase